VGMGLSGRLRYTKETLSGFKRAGAVLATSGSPNTHKHANGRTWSRRTWPKPGERNIEKIEAGKSLLFFLARWSR